MAITPIQSNIENNKTIKTYRDYDKPVDTTNNVKPIRPEGHLVHDSISSVPKYFIKDISYDIKAIKDGFQGNANDHQLGRLNDVGLKIGGIGIATILAARTRNPLLRVMEYTGLAAFLTAMSLYPKLAINLPSRLVHGFDIGKEYIDDQGRKKSVFQDSNYIPFDMYQGDYPGENLDIIGDRMGIPRNIEDRHDLIKEQMRKIATQNNTLWMVTAGVVPALAGLMCYGLERGIAKGIASFQNMKFNSSNSMFNSSIKNILTKTMNMQNEASSIHENTLSKDVKKLLSSYNGKELPKNEVDNLVNILIKDFDANTAKGIKVDVLNILQSGNNELATNFADNIITDLKKNIPNNKRTLLEKVFVPSTDEVNCILKNLDIESLSDDAVNNKLKQQFKELFDAKIAKESGVSKQFLIGYRNQVLEKISKFAKQNKSNILNNNKSEDLINFAKILGDFKLNKKALENCKHFKLEYDQETLLARSYDKFEKTLLKVLDIDYKELKQIKDSEKYASELFDKKLSELVKDDKKYQDAVEKLSKVISEMDIKLNGKDVNGAFMKDLITGIENNYNNTAKRLNKLGNFKNTIDKLVNEDVKTLSNSLKTRKDLYDMLDGVSKNQYANIDYWQVEDKVKKDYAKYNSKGVGSAKNAEITRIIERYQGVKNSYNRILHLFDVYKRPIPKNEYDISILKKGKEALMSATSSEHTMKLNTINNPTYYRDIMNTIWSDNLQASTQKGMDVAKDIEAEDVAGRFKTYINRFRDIIGNNNIDFTKPSHNLNPSDLEKYTLQEQTRMAKFNLIAQNPTELLKNAAKRKYGNQKWLRVATSISAGVVGTALLAQFCFGKISNPHNIRKKVVKDANN